MNKMQLAAYSCAALMIASAMTVTSTDYAFAQPQPAQTETAPATPPDAEKKEGEKKRFRFRDALPAIGAVVGAVTGALVCNQIGKQTGMNEAERARLMVACAALMGAGGWKLGGNIKRNLVEQDQVKVVTAMRESLRSGQAQRLELPDSGALAEISAGPEFKEVRTASLEFDPSTMTAPPAPMLQVIAATYTADSQQPLLVAPQNGAQSAAAVAPNTPIFVMGRVQGTDWLLVGRGGVAVGYINASRLRAAPAEAIAVDERPASVQTVQIQAEMTCRPMSLNLDMADPAKQDASQQDRMCTDAAGNMQLASAT